MSVEYLYEKNDINLATLDWLFVKNAGTIGQMPTLIKYDSNLNPSVLKLTYASELDQSQKSALDGVIANHNGEVLHTFVEWCPNCHTEKEISDIATPVKCPTCNNDLITSQDILRFDHIPIGTETKNETGAVPSIRNRLAINAKLYPLGVKVRLIVAGNKLSGGSGYVKLYDYTNAKTLGIMTFSNDIEVKELLLVDFPHAGLAVLELHLYTDGVGTMRIYSAVLEVG